jgi:hypothetical protein
MKYDVPLLQNMDAPLGKKGCLTVARPEAHECSVYFAVTGLVEKK